MTEDIEMSEVQKKDQKKPSVNVKLEWIFGIRHDITPNIFLLDKDTLVYPASNYIVLYNYTKNLGPLNLQHYIPGSNHSKGIVCLTASNLNKKYLGICEDTCDDGILISFYHITGKSGLKNYPDLQNSYELKEHKFNHTYCIEFSRRRKNENYIIALVSNENEYNFVCWSWDLEAIRENPLIFPCEVPKNKPKKNPVNNNNMSSNKNENEESENNFSDDFSEENPRKNSTNNNNNNNNKNEEVIEEKYVNIKRKFEISFSTASMENDSFSLTGNDFVNFYSIENKMIKEVEKITLFDEEGNQNEYGNEIYSSAWLYDGSFCFISDLFINIFEGKFKQLIHQLENPENSLRLITPYNISSNFEGFICGGINKKLQFYNKIIVNEESIENNARNNNVNNNNNNNENNKSSEENNENNNENENNENNNNVNPTETESKPTNEKYQKVYEKIKYEVEQTINEKIIGDKILQNDKISSNEKPFNYHSIVTYFDEQFCIASTSNNDLILINTDPKEINRELVKFLITPFHSDIVEGMDICINKPYIITCSKDKTVRVWNYQQKIHVISKLFEEELYSIAYHPSGMHALVSTEDKIYPLNIFYDEIDNMTQQITTKAKCKDIKFSHLGHLFAFDSGAVVQIWDFLNMQIFTGPPPYGQQKKNFSITSSKINFLNFRDDDKNLLAAGNDYIYDWQIKDEHVPSPKLPLINFTSADYIDHNSFLIATTDDKCLRKLQLKKDNANYIEEKFDFPMHEIHAFHRTPIVVCSTTKFGLINQDRINNQNNKDLYENLKLTTVLRVFPDIVNSTNNYIDIPAHQGETVRVRFNLEENKIFTCGEDGCINIYSIELPFDANEPEKYLSEQSTAFTNTVLIKKNRYKERDFDKKELPAKREEKLKKIRSENNDKRDTNKKILEEKKSKIASTKYTEKNIINQMKSELQNNELEYNNKIKSEIQSNVEEYDNQFNNNQIELSMKTREVEEIRDLIKQYKDDHKNQIQQITQEAKDVRQKHFDEFEAKKRDLEGNKNELEGKIKSLEISQKEDGEALKWLNEQVIFEIKSNIDELSKKIDELRVHYTHHIKKQKEEKEKLKQAGDDLIFELKKIDEEKERQKNHKEKNNENKKKAEEELKNMTKRITDIENKIIECKKAHTYLEKCKFVLSYKIQELKKEAGPMEKVLEDLQKRTKEDELSLSKYNREFDIISQKLVDLEDLKEKTKTHEKTERDLKNEINSFKIDLFNMLSYIDDYDKLREGFRNLREKYLKNYVPEVQDHELEGEFSNQKSKMKNRVFELQGTLNTLRTKHKDNISDNRGENNEMITKIEMLKNQIKERKKEKEIKSGDEKHANAVAEIFSGQIIQKLMLENISIKDKINLFKNKIKQKKEELRYLRKNVKIEEGYEIPNFAGITEVDEEEEKQNGPEYSSNVIINTENSNNNNINENNEINENNQNTSLL